MQMTWASIHRYCKADLDLYPASSSDHCTVTMACKRGDVQCCIGTGNSRPGSCAKSSHIDVHDLDSLVRIA